MSRISTVISISKLNSSSAILNSFKSPLPPTFQPVLEDDKKDKAVLQALGYIFFPLGAVAVILVVMALVLLVLHKRRLDRLRHRLIPLYNFDATEDDEEDWEAELLEDSSESYNLRRGYKSMKYPSSQS